MGFHCGIVGLPNVGKSTLFNAMSNAGAQVANYPFCTIDPNVGVVVVPDERLEFLGKVLKPEKTVPTTIEFVDIAGLVKGASSGEGLGNQFLAHIREVDAIAHVVRCFEDENIVHVTGNVDPVRDIEIVETELIIKDTETVDKRQAETDKKAKGGEKKLKNESDFYAALRAHLGGGKQARTFALNTDEEKFWMRDLHLLTAKPVMFVCNVHERDLRNDASEHVDAVKKYASREGGTVVVISAEVEAEVAELPVAEQHEFLESLGLQESGLSRVIRGGYELLHLLTFFTVNSKEAHAWTVRAGTKAPQAAGTVHSDFEQGFIRAEVMKYADLSRLGSEQAVKDAGLLHIQGREYAVEDGDIMYFRFNI